MVETKESFVREKIQFEIIQQGRKKTIFATFLGHSGKTASKIRAIDRILWGETTITLELLNQIASFLKCPIGYFLFGDIDSVISHIDISLVIRNIQDCFDQETKQKGKGRKKYQLGALLGGGGDDTAKIQTVNRILQQKKKLNINELEIIAQFFKKPLTYFLEAH